MELKKTPEELKEGLSPDDFFDLIAFSVARGQVEKEEQARLKSRADAIAAARQGHK